jgi:hypothetical protein
MSGKLYTKFDDDMRAVLLAHAQHAGPADVCKALKVTATHLKYCVDGIRAYYNVPRLHQAVHAAYKYGDMLPSEGLEKRLATRPRLARIQVHTAHCMVAYSTIDALAMLDIESTTVRARIRKIAVLLDMPRVYNKSMLCFQMWENGYFKRQVDPLDDPYILTTRRRVTC